MYYEERTGNILPTFIKEHTRTILMSLAIYFSDIKPSPQYYKSAQMSPVVFLDIGYDRANGIIGE
jgi:hypothetical protein